ncbi:Oxidoreductase, molybdopterin-binding domain-containing protein [Apodospora peruviana]|uniref:Nitrate reductase [NADPH] n=1 Tax=Apodospora peruviana TaxID=516989 RepID=A0AAE0M7I9_9PEZI|nr:Oxidoreductase, molybdopterin-binding domain-containing protein [Apodospora peruviana]
MATKLPCRRAVDLVRQACRRPTIPWTNVCHSCSLRIQSLHNASTRQVPAGSKPDRISSRPLPSSDGRTRTARVAPLSFLVGGGVLASALALWQSPDDHDFKPTPQLADDNSRDPSLPRFRLATIREEHGASSPHPWVTFEDKVYDITDWVAAHPGGDVILRAAGGSIEPYWNIFTIHKAPHVREILDQYLIGLIDVADLIYGRPAATQIEDPFENDPERDPRLITHTAKPRNAEPPNGELVASFRTPSELFYVRHHMWVPVVDSPESHVLTVELPDGETRSYTLAELKTRFPVHKVTAVLQCSGNRRNDMTRHAGKTNGLQWGVGAIGNAEWEGVRLADVLADAGLTASEPTALTAEKADDTVKVDPRSHHVQFSGLEAYGASIPLTKALDPSGDVLIAFGMNGGPLPRDHGFPLRAIVPGNVAARSVKWLSKIVVSDEESHSQWQRRDYKSFGPNEGANPDWDRARSIQEMPVTSAITGVWVGECVRRGKVPWGFTKTGDSSAVVDIAAQEKVVGFTPKDRLAPATTAIEKHSCPDKTPAEPVAIQGYAYSGGGRGIARVDVSLDGGKTWDQAELVDDSSDGGCHGNKKWAWTRWRYTGQLPILAVPSASDTTNNNNDSSAEKKKEKQREQNRKRYCTTLVVKATDDAYNTQPETHAGIYNVRGNLATAWHRVRICPTCITAAADAASGGDGKGKGVRWSTGETYGCGFGTEPPTGATAGSDGGSSPQSKPAK